MSKKHVKHIVQTISNALACQTDFVENLLTVPPDINMGDYAIPCFPFAKIKKKAPQQIADELREAFETNNYLFTKIQAVSGYLNFYIDRVEETKNTILTVLEEKDSYGTSTIGKGKTVLVEYSSPNVAKPIALHHLRSTMIGNAIGNIFEKLGYTVKRLNYLGDWGTNYGKLIKAFQLWGNINDIQERGITALVELYQKFEKEKNDDLEEQARETFKKLENGDKNTLKLWKEFKEISIKEFKRLYRRLNVQFDFYDSESATTPYIPETINTLSKKLTLKKSQGAEIIELPEELKLPPVLIRKSDGTTLYATRDIAEAIRRYEKYNFNLNLYVVATQQNLHFQAFIKVLSMLGCPWSELCKHVAFGMMLFNDKKMATRSGNMIYLEDVLNKAKDLALEIIKEKNPELKNKEETAEKIGLGAIIFNDLKNKRLKNVNFNWKDALNFDGETGPYVQYTYARISSMLRKAGLNLSNISVNAQQFVPNNIQNIEEIKLIKLISMYPNKIIEASSEYEPSVLAKYILELVSEFNVFYNKHRVINNEDKKLMYTRILLVSSVLQVMKNCSVVLNIPMPERM